MVFVAPPFVTNGDNWQNWAGQKGGPPSVKVAHVHGNREYIPDSGFCCQVRFRGCGGGLGNNRRPLLLLGRLLFQSLRPIRGQERALGVTRGLLQRVLDDVVQTLTLT